MSEEINQPFRLEIKVACIENYQKNSYCRLSTPISHTWRSKCIACSDDPLELKNYADSLPLECFFDRKRSYIISNVDEYGKKVFEVNQSGVKVDGPERQVDGHLVFGYVAYLQ